MKEYQLPFGKKKISLRLPADRQIQLIEPQRDPLPQNQTEILENALNNPINSLPLSNLTRQARKVLIITNDNTRPMPSKLTIPALVRSFYYPETYYDITILIATGLHRQMTREEILEQFGEKLFGRYPIVNHDARDKSSLAFYGTLRTGNELWLNKLVGQSDLVISEGFIEPHFFAGYSGGRKSILPGVAGAETILRNHCPGNIADPHSVGANLNGNPVHTECVEAAKAAGLGFILNVALNREKQIIRAFAGDPVDAHLRGCEFVREWMSVHVHPTDIVITSNNGYPLDRNLYQVVKGIDAASHVVRAGGVIIVVAQCVDGVGHGCFEELLLSCSSVEELDRKMSKPPNGIDKWQVQILARALRKSTVILVNETMSKEEVERLFLVHAASVEEALEAAFRLKGRDASISVMPEGPVVIPVVDS